MRSATDQGIFTGKGGPLTTIVNTTAGFVSFSNPSTNNSDIVTFKAALATGAQGVFVAKRGLLRTVAGTSGVFMGFADVVAINDRGTVAFLGLRTNRVQGFLSERKTFAIASHLGRMMRMRQTGMAVDHVSEQRRGLRRH
jgi:hypothetical protein